MPHQRLNQEEEKEKFEQFLFEMDDVLDAFKTEAASAGFVLDDTIASLDQLESFYLASSDKLKDPERFIGRAGRYLGEVLRINHGGKWQLAIEDPKDMYYGQPVIVGHTHDGVEFAPIAAFSRFSRRKQPGMLRIMIQNHVQPAGLNLKPEA